MSLRWYSTVIDARDVRGLAAWWAQTLGWRPVHESDEETVLVPGWVTEELVRTTEWDQVGPGLVFVAVPDERAGKNRLHLDLAPHTTDDRDAEIARLLERGASLAEVGQPDDASWTVLRDPEGNEFCVLSSREA